MDTTRQSHTFILFGKGRDIRFMYEPFIQTCRKKFPNAIVKHYSDDIKKQLQNGDTLIYMDVLDHIQMSNVYHMYIKYGTGQNHM